MYVMIETGEVLKVTQKQYWDTKSQFQAEVCPESFMRVGDLHLCVGRFRLAVYEETTPNIEDAHARPWKDLKGQERFMRYRVLFQFSSIEAALDRFPMHPMADKIREAMKEERDAWATKFPEFDMKPRAVDAWV